jgi:hypothetical protein
MRLSVPVSEMEFWVMNHSVCLGWHAAHIYEVGGMKAFPSTLPVIHADFGDAILAAEGIVSLN